MAELKHPPGSTSRGLLSPRKAGVGETKQSGLGRNQAVPKGGVWEAKLRHFCLQDKPADAVEKTGGNAPVIEIPLVSLVFYCTLLRVPPTTPSSSWPPVITSAQGRYNWYKPLMVHTH